jgi:hypothetical protein
MNETSKYKSSFTSGDLLQEEIIIILNRIGLNNILKNNFDKTTIVLKSKSEHTQIRTINESLRRIKAIQNNEVWDFFLNTNDQNQKLILFYAILLSYDLVLEFVLEVFHEKILNFQDKLTKGDFFAFLEVKSRTYPELEKKPEESIKKIQRSTYHVMRQVGVLKRNTIQHINIDDSLKKLFNSMGEGWFIEILPKK